MAKKHLYEIDLMRAFIMLSVICVHTTSYFNSLNQVDSPSYFTFGALVTSLHYTREGFFFITGLVLFVTYYRREFSPVQFWKKRFFLIAIPYLAWNIIYLVYRGSLHQTWDWSPLGLLQQLTRSVLTGDQFYLYFIVVSLQLYLVFPFLLYALRKLERWHVPILIGSFVFQLFLMWLNKFVLVNVHAASLPPVINQIDLYRDRFILTYQFWFVAGGIMACHYDKILAFVDRHVRALRMALVIGLLILWGHYFFDRLVMHESESLAELVLQPMMIPFSLIAAANMWYAGVQWSRRREAPGWGPFTRFVQLAANASFGIFLIQPFPLRYMEETVYAIARMHAPVYVHYILLPFAISFVYLAAMFISHWIGRIPLVAYIVGRKVNLPKRKMSPVSSAV